jgi:hypothetical protein
MNLLFQRLSQLPHERYKYFEVTIQSSKTASPVFGIGFAPHALPTKGMVGWASAGIGYHADDGRVFNNENVPSKPVVLELCTVGDTMGAAMDVETGHVFFTKNGQKLTGYIMNHVSATNMYPTVTLSHTESTEFTVNLGSVEAVNFKYEDIIPEMTTTYKLNSKERLTTVHDYHKADTMVTDLKGMIDRIITENMILKNQLQQLTSDTISKEHRFCLSTTEAMTMSDSELQRTRDQLLGSLDVIKNLEDRPDSCIVCADSKRTIVFIPCKHCVTCTACSDSMIECPVCRSYIQDRMSIFL